MSISPTPTAASSFPWLPVAVIGGIVLFIVAFTLFKKIGRSQTQSQVAELGGALGYTAVENAPADAPLPALASLQSLTHGRSHRFAHMMQSADGTTIFQLNYDTGALHGPSRWAYMVFVSPLSATNPSTLVLAPSGPDDLVSEFGYQDVTVAGRTVRTQDTASAEAVLSTPAMSAWLGEYPQALVELNASQIAVLLPGDLAAEGGGDPVKSIVEAGKKFATAIQSASAE